MMKSRCKTAKTREKGDQTLRTELDLHTHTLVSGHAYSTIREMARMASEKGLKILGITEHAPQMPGSCHEFYFQNLTVVPREMYGVRLLLGAELNILDENGTVDLSDRAMNALDIAIASIHPNCYKGPVTREAVTEAYLSAMENPKIHIIGHPDDGRFPADYERLVKKSKETGTLLELNNSSMRPEGFRVNAYENDREMLLLCKQYGVPVILGSDAHVDADIAAYETALKLLEECSFPDELVVNTSVQKLRKILAI